MQTMNEYKKKQMISREKIDSLEKNEMVLVNMNGSGYQLTKLNCLGGKKQAIQILLEKLHGITDEKIMYVPMKVEEIQECFEENRNFPINTFRKLKHNL